MNLLAPVWLYSLENIEDLQEENTSHGGKGL